MGLDDLGERLAARNSAKMFAYGIMAFCGLLAVAWNGLRTTSPAFCGELVSDERENPDRDSFNTLHLLEIRQDDGSTVIWKLDESTAIYYKVGDYLIKEKNERYPAVFRQGRQLKSPGVAVYKEEPVDIVAARAKFKAGSSASADAIADAARDAKAEEGLTPGGGASLQLAAPSELTEADAKALLDEAGALWGKGDKAGALSKSEAALAIRLKIYGEKHPLVDDARKRIEAAKRQMPN